MTAHPQTLQRLVDRAGRLYSLPGVAMQVLQLTSSPKVDTWALKKCIENDPALTTKVLRVVNSSLFGLSRQVSDLNQALALLGTKPLKLLVLGFSLPDGLSAGVNADILQRYWSFTLTKAVAARELSESFWHQPGDEAFIVGLLQDLGMLLLLQEMGEPYAKFASRAWSEGRDVASLETSSLGFDHIELSARLLETWGLPESVVQAIAVGPSADKLRSVPPAERSVPQIVHMADLLALLLCERCTHVLPELLELGNRYRGMSHGDLGALVGTLQDKVKQLADVLSLDLPAGQDYRDVLIQAHSQLSEVAFDEAGEVLRRGEVAGEKEEETQGLLDEIQSLAAAVAKLTHAEKPPAKPTVDVKAVPSAAKHAVHAAHRSQKQGAAKDIYYSPESISGETSSHEADPGLIGRVMVAVAACRQARCAVSLLLVEIDRLSELIMNHGPEGTQKLIRLLHATCRSVDHPHATCLQIREGCFAILLPDCERESAVELGTQLIRQVRHLGRSAAQESGPLTVSAGVATVALPPKNFSTRDLIDSAERCLYGAQSCGGAILKSISVY